MSLTIEILCQALQASFSANKVERNNAEAAIKSLENIPGSSPLLLQIIATHGVDKFIRQAAAVALKNLCRRVWVHSDPAKIMYAQDKVTTRVNALEVIMIEPEASITKILAETINSIAITDYPNEWPDLLTTLLTNVQEGGARGEAVRVHGALVVLRKLAKRYEYKGKDQRGPLTEIITRGFPLLTTMMGALIKQDTNEAAGIMKQTLKVFWSCTQFNLDDLNHLQLESWFLIFLELMNKKLYDAEKNIPPLNQPTDPEGREKWVWWKVKKWTAQIITRFFARYGNPKSAEEGKEEFARYFSDKVAPQFLQPVCETLALRSQNEFCTDRVIMLCLSYIDTCIEQKKTWLLLKPHLDFLLYNVCYNVVKMTPEQVELFDNDPHEHIQRVTSLQLDWVDPKMQALTLVEDLVKFRTATVAGPLMNHLVNIISTYTASGGNGSHVDMDCALRIIGSLSSFLMNEKKGTYKQQLPALLVMHVLPLLNSPIGILRSRACSTVVQFSEVPLDSQSFVALLQSVMAKLNDTSLPVQIEASKAMQFLIQNPEAGPVILPNLPALLDSFFRIMNEVGNDDVVTSLDVLIEQYGDQMAPHAIALVNNLCNTFNKYIDVDEEDDEEGQASMAATVCLECVATVLNSVKDREDIFMAVEPQLIPIVAKILHKDGELIEFLEHALDFLTFFTYYQKKITPALWSLFPLMFQAFHEYAFDYLPNMVAPIDNYVNTDMEGFCTLATPDGKKYIELVFEAVAKVLTMPTDVVAESDARKALGLLVILFQSAAMKPQAKPLVNNYLHIAVDLTLSKLVQQEKADIPTSRVQCYVVLGSLLFYDIELTMQELEKRNVVKSVVDIWMEDGSELERWMAKKATALGWLGLLSLGTERLTKNGVDPTSIFRGVIEVAKSIAEDYSGNDDEDEEGDNGQNVWEDVDDEQGNAFADVDEDADIDLHDNAAYNKVLHDQAMFAGYGGGFDFDDDGEDDLESPLDDVDELFVMEQVFASLEGKEPQAFAALRAGLPEEVVNDVNMLALKSQERKVEAAKKAAAK